MLPAVFQINNRFVVSPSQNELLNKQTRQKKRLEPRLMQLLCLLAVKNGALVDRAYLIETVWNNYPGASEGLNQAISILRKLLEDEDKIIIRTIPKSGYIFTGEISNGEIATPPAAHGKLFKWMSLATAIVLIIFLALNLFVQPASAISKQDLDAQQGAEISRRDSAHQAEMYRQYNH
jgi:DNA-binding winged helix-turn-helix (wHTH) protein